MAKLGTWDFLKKLATHTMQGDPLAVVEDIRESAQADAKEENDRGTIEAHGESEDEP